MFSLKLLTQTNHHKLHLWTQWSLCLILSLYQHELNPVLENAGRLHVVNDGKMVYSGPDGDNCSWAISTSTEVEYVSTILNPCGIDQKPCTQWNRNMIQISHTGQLYLDIISENELDFETASALITVIEITDPNGLYARGTVEVDIVDVNEAPLFDERIMKSFFVIEESAVGTAWITLKCNDFRP